MNHAQAEYQMKNESAQRRVPGWPNKPLSGSIPRLTSESLSMRVSIGMNESCPPIVPVGVN